MPAPHPQPRACFAFHGVRKGYAVRKVPLSVCAGSVMHVCVKKQQCLRIENLEPRREVDLMWNMCLIWSCLMCRCMGDIMHRMMVIPVIAFVKGDTKSSDTLIS
jgi:hypothetical protein